MCDLQKAVSNIIGLRFLNICRYQNSTTHPSPPPHKCSVYLEMKNKPYFVYHDLGRYLVAYDNETGAMHSFEYKQGSKDGFAGREITLPIIGRGTVFKNKGVSRVTFKGDLWDTTDAKQACYDYFKTTGVSVAYIQRYKNTCAISIEIDERVLKKIMNLAHIEFKKDN